MNRELVGKISDLCRRLHEAEECLQCAKQGVQVTLSDIGLSTGRHNWLKDTQVIAKVQVLVIDHYTKEVQDLGQQLADL